MRTRRPASWRLRDQANGLGKLQSKLRSARFAAAEVPIKCCFVFRTCFIEKLDGLSGHG